MLISLSQQTGHGLLFITPLPRQKSHLGSGAKFASKPCLREAIVNGSVNYATERSGGSI